MKYEIKRVPVLEPDSDGPIQTGGTHGIETSTDDGCVVFRAGHGVTGSRAELERILPRGSSGWRSCCGRKNQLPGKPCAICGHMTHKRGTAS